jgi:hypothetical protein
MKRLTKKRMQSLINSLLVWSLAAHEAARLEQVERARNAMRWFNQAADELETAGIAVHKYE